MKRTKQGLLILLILSTLNLMGCGNSSSQNSPLDNTQSEDLVASPQSNNAPLREKEIFAIDDQEGPQQEVYCDSGVGDCLTVGEDEILTTVDLVEEDNQDTCIEGETWELSKDLKKLNTTDNCSGIFGYKVTLEDNLLDYELDINNEIKTVVDCQKINCETTQTSSTPMQQIYFTEIPQNALTGKIILTPIEDPALNNAAYINANFYNENGDLVKVRKVCSGNSCKNRSKTLNFPSKDYAYSVLEGSFKFKIEQFSFKGRSP